MSVGRGRLYILAEGTDTLLDRLEIQFVPPELNFDRRPEVSPIQIVGRNIPKYHYGGGSRTFEIQLDFYSELENRTDVIRKCRIIESWSANDGHLVPPKRVKVIWGSLFSGSTSWWIITACPYRISNFDKTTGFLPRQAYMDLTLTEDSDTIVTRKDILSVYDGNRIKEEGPAYSATAGFDKVHVKLKDFI